MIKGIQKISLIDFPGKISCTIFLGGCSFRCGYCYNSDLVLNPASLPEYLEKDFFGFLDKRKGQLDGVCITGGEPTLYKDLPELCRKIREKGYLVKLDSNGTSPEMLEKLINEKLIDYIAMDIKSSFDSYEKVVGVKVNKEKLKKSIELIMNSGLEYEFRTTIIPDVINENEMKKIGGMVKGAKKYFLQQFNANEKTIDKKYSSMASLTKEHIEKLKEIVKPFVKEVGIRNLN